MSNFGIFIIGILILIIIWINSSFNYFVIGALVLAIILLYRKQKSKKQEEYIYGTDKVNNKSSYGASGCAGYYAGCSSSGASSSSSHSSGGSSWGGDSNSSDGGGCGGCGGGGCG